MRRLFVPGPLPGLNEIINAKANRHRGGRSAYTKMKARWGDMVALLAHAQRFTPVEQGHFTYLFRERNKRRDPSNVIGGGVKILEDGLQAAGLLPNDGWGQVLSINPHWMVDSDTPGATVFVTRYPMLEETAVLCAIDDTWRAKSKTQ